MNKNNDFVQSLKARIIYKSREMGVVSFYDDSSKELQSKNTLSFATRINNTYSLGRHNLRFFIPENDYYRELNTTFVINIGKARANLTVLGSDQFEIQYRDTLTVFAFDKYNQTISNVNITMQIGTYIQHKLTSKDGLVLFALDEIMDKDQAEGMNLTLDAQVDNYFFVNVTYVVHYPKTNNNIPSQLVSLVGNFGNHGLLKAIGIVTVIQILSNRLQRRNNKMENNKKGSYSNRNNWRFNTNR